MLETKRSKADAFKVGFLTKLASEGITPDEFYRELTKQADGLLDAVGGIGGAVTNAAKLGLVAPIAAGGALGVGQSLLDAPASQDIELLQKAEILRLYQRLTDEIRARKEQALNQ